jgi:hypothetical protein
MFFLFLFLLYFLWKIVFYLTLHRPARLLPFTEGGRVEICKDMYV